MTASGAVEAFDRVLRICVDTGAARDAARARKRLRELGIRRRVQSLDRPKSGWESLTDAELQVASLAAAGHTNRGIADRLFVSPHTVNTHLRHVFGKLDISVSGRSRPSRRAPFLAHAHGRCLLSPPEALKREPDPGGQVKVQPGRPVVQVAAE